MSDRNVRKTKVGKVVSDKMDKTVVVAVEELKQHKLYKKAIKTGDKVSIMETRPLSKDKRWRVVEVIERAK